MTKIETALKKGRKVDVSGAATAAASFAENAASTGALDVAYMETELPIGGVLIAATKRGLVLISYNAQWIDDHF